MTRSFLAAGLSLAAAVAVWSGCTVTQSNYKTLSFFFDGVPDPSNPLTRIDASTGEVKTLGNVSVHKPYEQEQCGECHSGRDTLNRNSSHVCMKCHQQVPTEHAVMHGPVVAGACLWCHNPHESTKPHLMRDADRKVCTQCHLPASLSTMAAPEHADESRGCLECHAGHGGERPLFLKPRPATPDAPPKSAAPVEGPAAPTTPKEGA
jgi:predicted CXXCH cytochrome family protein